MNMVPLQVLGGLQRERESLGGYEKHKGHGGEKRSGKFVNGFCFVCKLTL